MKRDVYISRRVFNLIWLFASVCAAIGWIVLNTSLKDMLLHFGIGLVATAFILIYFLVSINKGKS